ncbi:MAG: hypothetical protein AB7H81_09485 [Vicinamibacterales bacterium]
MFAGVVDQSVRFGQKTLLALRVEFRDARERERASIRRNGFPKNGLALLTVPRRLPLANRLDSLPFKQVSAGMVGWER